MPLSSLRFHLLLVILLALVPVSALMVITDWEQRRITAAGIQADALRVARLAAAEQERFVAATHQLLVTLAQLPQVSADAPARSRCTPTQVMS